MTRQTEATAQTTVDRAVDRISELTTTNRELTNLLVGYEAENAHLRMQLTRLSAALPPPEPPTQETPTVPTEEHTEDTPEVGDRLSYAEAHPTQPDGTTPLQPVYDFHGPGLAELFNDYAPKISAIRGGIRYPSTEDQDRAAGLDPVFGHEFQERTPALLRWLDELLGTPYSATAHLMLLPALPEGLEQARRIVEQLTAALHPEAIQVRHLGGVTHGIKIHHHVINVVYAPDDPKALRDKLRGLRPATVYCAVPISYEQSVALNLLGSTKLFNGTGA